MNDCVSKPVSPQALAEVLALAAEERTMNWEGRVRGKTPPPVPHSSAPMVFERASMLERLMNDEDLAREVTESFIGNIPRQIEALRRGGTLVAYVGRSLDGSVPKHRLPAGFRKSQVLFNFHRAAAWNQETVVVVEGHFDCLKVHQAGFPSVVALMGTVLLEALEVLLGQFRRVILMLDRDDSSRRATERIAVQPGGQMLRSPSSRCPPAASRTNWTGTKFVRY
jgi:hypothetical protein